ncbi:hypothetical protein Ndes2526A_g07626 [Nannochloris sp. 'desiccata']
MAPLYSRLRHPTRRNCQHAISLRRQRGKLAYPSWYGKLLVTWHLWLAGASSRLTGLSSPSTSLCGSWSLSSYSPAKSTWLAPCLLPFLLSQQPSSCSLQTLGTGLTGVGDELDGTFKKRARTALAGAAIAAASEFHVADGVGPPRREGHRPFLRNAKKWGTVRVMWRLLYP